MGTPSRVIEPSSFPSSVGGISFVNEKMTIPGTMHINPNMIVSVLVLNRGALRTAEDSEWVGSVEGGSGGSGELFFVASIS